MDTEGQAARTLRQAQISFLPAILGLAFLIFGRVSNKIWGLVILAALLPLIRPGSPTITSLQSGIERLKTLSFPTLIQTVHSPSTQDITEEEILEAQGLVKTPSGPLPFNTKLRVFATSYDKHCPGCGSRTATGLPTGFGVVAVDPKVIPLGTKLFVPGYGIALAGDTGGAIKGNRIDLGFDDVKTGWWSSRFVDVYVLK